MAAKGAQSCHSDGRQVSGRYHSGGVIQLSCRAFPQVAYQCLRAHARKADASNSPTGTPTLSKRIRRASVSAVPAGTIGELTCRSEYSSHFLLPFALLATGIELNRQGTPGECRQLLCLSVFTA